MPDIATEAVDRPTIHPAALPRTCCLRCHTRDTVLAAGRRARERMKSLAARQDAAWAAMAWMAIAAGVLGVGLGAGVGIYMAWQRLPSFIQ